jgi:site-specific recombinase XerC
MRHSVTAAALLALTACAAPATTPGTSSPSTSAGAPAAQRRAPAHLDTDAWTQAMANESGQEIHIRNKSTVPIIVTEVTLSSCMNLADACGSHFPRVRIEAGSVRRVLRVRYGGGNVVSSFQYRYRVEPADPERG